MPRTLTVRDVPDTVVKALRERARRNKRSMQKEILFILESCALDRSALARHLSELRTRLDAKMSLREIHDAIEEGLP
jgi:plasmid stability protein